MLGPPVCGTLRGAGEEKVGRCFEGVLAMGVGVAMTVTGDSRGPILRGEYWETNGAPIAGERVVTCCAIDVDGRKLTKGRMRSLEGKARASQVLAPQQCSIITSCIMCWSYLINLMVSCSFRCQ
jgi:hypothetical protein